MTVAAPRPTGHRPRPVRSLLRALVALPNLGKLSLAAFTAGGALLLWSGANRAVGRGDPIRTFVDAAELLRRAVELPAAREVSWYAALDATDGGVVRVDGGSLYSGWETFLAPRSPPALCGPPVGIERGVRSAVTALNATVRWLEDGDQRELAVERARALRGQGTTPAERFLVGYSAARAFLLSGNRLDASAVLAEYEGDVVHPVQVLSAPARLTARRVMARGDTTPEHGARAFLGRYLQGHTSLARGLGEQAITEFRTALNATNFVAGADPAWSGHHIRTEVPLAEWGCVGTRADESLTSLDAYNGLIAGYLATAKFTQGDAAFLREVRRTPGEMEPDDALRPLLLYAADRPWVGGELSGPIPEHFLWAVSNLQRVLHANGRAPDPRLEALRAVVMLMVSERPGWASALDSNGSRVVCTMLSGAIRDLSRSGLAPPGDSLSPADSVLAAMPVYLQAEASRSCGPGGFEAVPEHARSRVLAVGDVYLPDGLSGRYELRRLALERATASGSVDSTAEAVFASTDRERAQLSSGRIGFLPGRVDPDAGAAFIRAWERAVFSDVASALAAELRTGFNPREAIDDEVRDRFVRTLESATALSGARPSDLYAVEELVPLSLEWSPLARIGLRVRYWLQDHRWIAVGAILPATALALLFGIFWMHVAVWRGFLVGGSWYLRELRAASSVPTRPPGPPA